MLCDTVADENARRTGDTLGNVELVTQVCRLADRQAGREVSEGLVDMGAKQLVETFPETLAG